MRWTTSSVSVDEIIGIRRLRQTIHYLQLLDACGVRFHSYTEEYLSTDNELVRDLLLTILAHFARLEAEKISRRTRAGLERARANGTRIGRPSKVERYLERVAELREEHSVPEIAGTLGISESTVRRCLKRLKERAALPP